MRATFLIPMLIALAAQPAQAQMFRKKPPPPPPASAHPNARLCVVGQKVEANEINNWTTSVATVTGPLVDGPPRCEITYDISGQRIYPLLDYIRPLSAETLAKLAATEAALKTYPPHMLEARRQFLALFWPAKCRDAYLGLAGGQDTARWVADKCGYNAEQWAKARALGPTPYSLTNMAFDLNQSAAFAAQANANQEQRRREEAERARIEAAAKAPPAYSGGLGLNTTPNLSTAMSGAAGGGATGVQGEATMRREMQSNACMGNAARC